MLIAIGLMGGGALAGALWYAFEHAAERIWLKNLGRPQPSPRVAFFRKRPSVNLMELADFLDLMALGISGGLNMENAWRLGVEHTRPGSLKKELEWVQAALHLGRPREEAFEELDRRLAQESLHLFFALLVQSVRAGSRLQNLLHDQAASLRRTLLIQMERRAQLAPLRLLVPLFLFIFPTIFLILFGPVAVRFAHGGSLF